MASLRILLIRHGQTSWNRDGRWQGILQIPLNDIGVQQAAALAEYLRDVPLRAVYSSDLDRAFETARPLATAHGLDVIPEPRLREMHLGVFQGLTRVEIMTQYAKEWDDWHANPLDYVVPEGESRRMMQDRSHAALLDAIESLGASADLDTISDGDTLAMVTHGGTIRNLIIRLFDFDPNGAHIDIHNTSITSIDYDTETKQFTLVELAATPHLRRADPVEKVDGA